MELVEYYRQQHRWRHWPRIYEALPELRGHTILDLGCGVGDQAADLAGRGGQVIGIDANGTVVAAAKDRGLVNCQFAEADLRTLPSQLPPVDGIWSSFTAAYFPAFEPVLRSWLRLLRVGGWVALTEIDDLFGHLPLSERSRSYFRTYADEALAADRYDFFMGHKLADHASRAGLSIVSAFSVPDEEFCRSGPLDPGVVTAWRMRLEGMSLFREYCGAAFAAVRDEFLSCLDASDHQSLCRVCCVIGQLRGAV